jgi:hypothetical protein
MGATLGWILFGLGAFLCLVNFYLSFLRRPLRRLRGLPDESDRWVSGFPLLGSLLVALSMIGLHEVPGMIPLAAASILIDTGGIHWFVGSLFHRFVHEKRRG